MKTRFLNILGYSVLVGVLTMIGIDASGTIHLNDTALGFLISIASAVVMFYFRGTHTDEPPTPKS